MLGELKYSFTGGYKLGYTFGMSKRTHQATKIWICKPGGAKVLNLYPFNSAIKQSSNQVLKKKNM